MVVHWVVWINVVWRTEQSHLQGLQPQVAQAHYESAEEQYPLAN